jgi:hypothetical protein
LHERQPNLTECFGEERPVFAEAISDRIEQTRDGVDGEAGVVELRGFRRKLECREFEEVEHVVTDDGLGWSREQGRDLFVIEDISGCVGVVGHVC